MTGRADYATPWRAEQQSATGDYDGNGGSAGGHGSQTEHHHGLLGRFQRGPGSRLPLRRERQGRLAGGVVVGISAKTGVDVTALRVGLVVLTLLTSGFAAAIYVLTWVLLPMTGDTSNIASRALTDKRGIALAAGLGSVLGVVLIVASSLQAEWLNAVAWPIIICVCGLVLIWRNAD
jgi:phage shock protein PspC (stress-responsive transcriptional regulator)